MTHSVFLFCSLASPPADFILNTTCCGPPPGLSLRDRSSSLEPLEASALWKRSSPPQRRASQALWLVPASPEETTENQRWPTRRSPGGQEAFTKVPQRMSNRRSFTGDMMHNNDAAALPIG